MTKSRVDRNRGDERVPEGLRTEAEIVTETESEKPKRRSITAASALKDSCRFYCFIFLIGNLSLVVIDIWFTDLSHDRFSFFVYCFLYPIEGHVVPGWLPRDGPSVRHMTFHGCKTEEVVVGLGKLYCGFS